MSTTTGESAQADLSSAQVDQSENSRQDGKIRRVTIFDVRDYINALADAAELPESLDKHALHVLDTLILNTMFRDYRHGWVHTERTSHEFLTARTRISSDTLTRALRSLQDGGLVTRIRQGRKSHNADEISLQPLLDLVAAWLLHRRERHRTTSTPQGADLSDTAGSGIAARARSSSLKREKSKNTSSTSPPLRGSDDDAAGPSGGDGEDLPGSPSAVAGAQPLVDDPDAEYFRGLAEYLASVYYDGFDPRLLAPHFLAVSRFLGVSAYVLEEAVLWWLDGNAPARFRQLGDEKLGNVGGYLHYILPDLVHAYLEARKRKAKDLGADPGSFDLCQYLRDHGNEQAHETQQYEAGCERVSALQAEAERTRQETSQLARQGVAEIRALMETIVPHKATFDVEPGQSAAASEEGVRLAYTQPVVGGSHGRPQPLAEDDVPGWRRKARLLASHLGSDLRFAAKERPGDPDLAVIRKFFDELIVDNPWLAG